MKRACSSTLTSRRAVLSAMGGVGFTAALGALTRESRATPPTIAGVSLPPYPFFPNLAASMTPAPDLLDDLAARYGKHASAADPVDFLLRYVPATLFDDVVGPSGGAGLAIDESLWALHIVGYFGGIWLRKKLIERSGPRPGFAPFAGSFAGVAAKTVAATNAATGPGDAALAFVEANLRGAANVGLVDSYGYNAGYLAQILGAAKPVAATAPPGYLTFSPTNLLDATYAVPDLQALSWNRVRARVAEKRPGSRWDAIVLGTGGVSDLHAIQQAAAARGAFTWSLPFLSIAGWDQASYDTLLSTSAYFLQTTQATALGALAAASIGDDNRARAVAWGIGLLSPFGGSYGVGLFDPTYDAAPLANALPSFV